MKPGGQPQANWASNGPCEVRTSSLHDSDAPTEPTAQSRPPLHKVAQVDLQAGLLRLRPAHQSLSTPRSLITLPNRERATAPRQYCYEQGLMGLTAHAPVRLFLCRTTC